MKPQIVSKKNWESYNFCLCLRLPGCEYILCYVGRDLDRIAAGLGTGQLEKLYDIGLSEAPEGMSVWQGQQVGKAGQQRLDGRFRAPTPYEVQCVVAGVPPWAVAA